MRALEDLISLSKSELDRIFEGGTEPDADDLVGWEFRGFNVALVPKIGGFQKFKKGFAKDGDFYWGYNVPVRQGGPDAPWTCRPSDEFPKRFGFYSVRSDQDGKEPGSLRLNYGEGKNKLWEGSFLRDYLRQVDADNPNLLLGRAYMSVAGKLVFSNYFVLERHREAPGEPQFPS